MAQREGMERAGGPLDEAFRAGRRVRLRPDQVLFEEGDASNRVILVLSGRVRISSFSEEGQETVLGYRGGGDLLGELSAIDGEPHLATVTVVDAGEALVLPADRFVSALRAEPDLAMSVLRALVRRLRDADRKRAEFTELDVVGRVARRLVELAEDYGRSVDAGTLVDLAISQRQLAGWVGSSREAVNKALAHLQARDLIVTERRQLIVRDVAGLRSLSR